MQFLKAQKMDQAGSVAYPFPAHSSGKFPKRMPPGDAGKY
jgi:hypothetical protein